MDLFTYIRGLSCEIIQGVLSKIAPVNLVWSQADYYSSIVARYRNATICRWVMQIRLFLDRGGIFRWWQRYRLNYLIACRVDDIPRSTGVRKISWKAVFDLLYRTSYDMHWSPRLITRIVHNWLTATYRSWAVYYTPVAGKRWSTNQILASASLRVIPIHSKFTYLLIAYFTEDRITVIHQRSASLITLIAANELLFKTGILIFPTCLHYCPGIVP